MGPRARVGTAFLLTALLTALLVPLWLAELPALADLPNHLARIHILNNIDRAPFAEVFRADWAILPNLGFDLFMVAATGLGLGYMVSAKLFLSLGAAMIVGGAALLSWRIAGRITPLALMAAPLFYSGILYLGFLSFVFSIGVMLLMAGLFYGRLSLRVGNLLLLSASACLLFIIHLYGLAALYWCLGCFVLAERWRGEIGTGQCIRRLLLLCTTLTLPALALLGSPTADATVMVELSSPETKLLGLFFFLAGLGQDIDWVFGRGLFGLVAGGLMILCLRVKGGYRIAAPGLLLLVTGLVVYTVLPYRLFSSFNADWRFLLPFFVACGACLLVVDETAERKRPSPVELAAFAAVFFLTVVQAVIAVERNEATAKHLQALQRVTAELPQGSRLFTFAPGIIELHLLSPPPLLHIAGLLVLEKDVVLPSVFAIEGQQPLAYAADFEPAAKAASKISYIDTPPNWPLVARDFGYALRLAPNTSLPRKGAPETGMLPSCLEELAHEYPFTLYKIRAVDCS